MSKRLPNWLRHPLVIALVSGGLGIGGTLLAKIDHMSIGGGTEWDFPPGPTKERTVFHFSHQNRPPGCRTMQQLDNSTWRETQPDGTSLQHTVLGRVTKGPWPGLILRRLESPDQYPVDLFVPNAGVSMNALLYRPTNGGAWVAVSVVEDGPCP